MFPSLDRVLSFFLIFTTSLSNLAFAATPDVSGLEQVGPNVQRIFYVAQNARSIEDIEAVRDGKVEAIEMQFDRDQESTLNAETGAPAGIYFKMFLHKPASKGKPAMRINLVQKAIAEGNSDVMKDSKAMKVFGQRALVEGLTFEEYKETMSQLRLDYDDLFKEKHPEYGTGVRDGISTGVTTVLAAGIVAGLTYAYRRGVVDKKPILFLSNLAVAQWNGLNSVTPHLLFIATVDIGALWGIYEGSQRFTNWSMFGKMKKQRSDLRYFIDESFCLASTEYQAYAAGLNNCQVDPGKRKINNKSLERFDVAAQKISEEALQSRLEEELGKDKQGAAGLSEEEQALEMQKKLAEMQGKGEVPAQVLALPRVKRIGQAMPRADLASDPIAYGTHELLDFVKKYARLQKPLARGEDPTTPSESTSAESIVP